MALLSRFLGKVIKQGTLKVTYHDGRTEQFGKSAEGFPDVGIRFTDSKVLRDIMLDVRLGAGEAFMDGRLVIEDGDIMDFIQLIRQNRPWEQGGELREESFLRKLVGQIAFRLDGLNDRQRSKSNVAHHYDIGNDLYRMFLDTDMQYSCAYWPEPDITLEEAQMRKKAHIVAKLNIKPGQRVLDIGCGWGGTALYIHAKTGAEVVGITLSEEQLKIARERAAENVCSDKVTFELIDYRDLAAREPGSFDRIVSIGMFEHVGQRNFGTYFRATANLLKDDGAMLIHTIGRMGEPGRTDAFTRKYIFPGGYIPALSETIAASEKSRLIATDIETLRLHYALTLREWYKRTVAHETEIIAMYDARFYRMWTFYLAGATAAFESGGMCNYQIQFARNRHALPLTRDYLAANEAELLA